MRISYVDVFSTGPLSGNPVAVVHDADQLSQHQMQSFAAWTNLSETTFLLKPTTTKADYRLRIFSPTQEFPFAGHPTLGSAAAWLAAGGAMQGTHIVQECSAGLIPIQLNKELLSFQAPALLDSSPLSPAHIQKIPQALGIDRDHILKIQRVDNGTGWIGVLLNDVVEVGDIKPNYELMGGLKLGVVSLLDASDEDAMEVRAFNPSIGEDPVTGSLNAGLAQWLIDEKRVPVSYSVRQGSALGRAGRLFISQRADALWVGGYCSLTVSGTVRI
ncbi:PhzF family phenazine biosynthesis protein [Corynebacterium pseudotuberculosis]|uniref:PhzF family phenazine biosynthesis protein n=1 Tax=Corynebacterium pseudotuberculosis TaxID=1719 RepID=UPI00065E38F3|nr:PhzF family phenazine biosynthesis protein [Corynebacterium pseudotuberculosis]AKP08588.1 PhzF family phenazine biosynthesis protein [Corynebacterium pseudotuberculosis]